MRSRALITLPLWSVVFCVVVTGVFDAGLWLDSLIAGLIVCVIGMLATGWMLQHSGGDARKVPSIFLAGTGLTMLGFLASSLVLILVFHTNPIATLTTGLMTVWSLLFVDVMAMRRLIQASNTPISDRENGLHTIQGETHQSTEVAS